MKFNRNTKLILAAILLFDLLLVLLFVKWTLSDNVNSKNGAIDLFIHSGSEYGDVKNNIESNQLLKNNTLFDMTAWLLKYNESVIKPGRYVLKPGMNSFDIVRLLRAGNQTPVKVTFNNVRTIEELTGRVSKQLEPDSLSLLKAFRDTALINSLGYSDRNILTMCIPNTYEIYWNINPEGFIRRMLTENVRFWNSRGRTERALELGLTHSEVYILASIVEKETLVSDEKPLIASVYLNRLRTGQKLQADPTVVYAMGDFELKRLLHVHLEYDSPYNTYLHSGLPPGPIYMPDIATIDAVLNHKETDYMFFCAAPGGSGRHLFAVTYRQHMQNASRYHKWLNENSIK